MQIKTLKIRLVSIFLCCFIFLSAGCGLQKDESDQAKSSTNNQTENLQKKADTAIHMMLGSWQSVCNTGHFGKPVITSIEIRRGFIRWTNHFYKDKACLSTDEVIREDYRYTYIKDVRILGDVWAHLFWLEPGLNLEPGQTDRDFDGPGKNEVFRVEDNWLYISLSGSGPDFDQPWTLDSNFGLRRSR